MPPIPPEYLKILEYLGWGALGGLVGGTTKSGRLALPRLVVKRDSDGEVRKWIDPGFLVSVFVGATAAAIVDGRPQTALMYGLGFGYAGPAAIRALSERVVKLFGYAPDLPELPKAPPLADEVNR